MLLRCQSPSMASVRKGGRWPKPVREKRTSDHGCSSTELLGEKGGCKEDEGKDAGKRAAER